MANNIYIGNRYVPIFANPVEWDNLREYEPLTIVTYNGTAYTSRQRVPVGTELSNTDYWVVTGNYNAQVEEYRQEVVGLRNDLTDLSGDVSELDSDIDGVSDRVTDIENSMNRKYVFIGDSYINITSDYPNSYVTPACEILGATVGTNAWRFGAGGAGFVGATQGQTFMDVLNTAHTELASISDTITDVIIAGGCNDAESDIAFESILTAKNSWFATCRNYFPNARIFISCVGGFQRFDRLNQLTKVKRAYYYGNNKNVIPIFDGGIPMCDNGNFGSDFTHPNQNGLHEIGMLLGSAVYSISNYGYASYKVSNINFNSYDSSISAHDGNLLRCMFTPSGVELHNTQFNMTYSSPKSVAYNVGATLPIGSYNRGAFGLVGITNNTELTGYIDTVPCRVLGYNGDHSWNEYMGYLCFVYNANTGAIDVSIRIFTGVKEGSHTIFRVEGLNKFIPML